MMDLQREKRKLLRECKELEKQIMLLDEDELGDEKEEPTMLTRLSKKVLGTRRCHGGCH